MALLNEKLKMITCSDFRIFLKKMIKDKIEKDVLVHDKSNVCKFSTKVPKLNYD